MAPARRFAAVAASALLLAVLLPRCGSSQEGYRVTFVVNDATVKDKLLPGVRVAVARAAGDDPFSSGETGTDGRFTCTLPPATYAVSYRLAGYVPIADSPTAVSGDGQVVTTTLSMMLEAEGAAPGERRVRIILNWGSDSDHHIRDADSHVLCPCAARAAHVYYSAKQHQGAGHSVDLDVDDTDWGGPETVTLHDPPPGDYSYWVYDFSGPPPLLGTSEVVVRVLVGDQVVGEYRPPRGVDARCWHPFKALMVGADLEPRVLPFTPDELAAGDDLVIPAGYEGDGMPVTTPESGASNEVGCGLTTFALSVIAISLAIAAARLLARRRRGSPTSRRRPKLPP
jgi:hypothetical protein